MVTREEAEALLNKHEEEWIGKLGVLQREEMVDRYQKTMQKLRDQGLEIIGVS